LGKVATKMNIAEVAGEKDAVKLDHVAKVVIIKAGI
jgi:hypothetical protein